MVAAAIAISQVSKHFRGNRGRRCKALDAVSFTIQPGEMVALIGASGSGKSTLMRHISGLVNGDAGDGEIVVGGRCVQHSGRVARDVRSIRTGIGFVFQQFNLVGRMSVLTNVLAGMLGRTPTWRALPGWFTLAERRLAMEALARVGMADCATQRASTLSGGQQQRAAIARALVQRAQVILGDEPIASLDPESCRKVMQSLARINREDGVTVLVSLHQVDFAIRYCPRVIALSHGRVVYDGPSQALTPALLQAIYGAQLEEAGLDEESALIAVPLTQPPAASDRHLVSASS